MNSFLEKISTASLISFDIETDSPSHEKPDNLNFMVCYPVVIGMAYFDKGILESNAFILEETSPEDIYAIKCILSNPEIRKVGHNIKFDVKVANKWFRDTGYETKVKGVYWDTSVAYTLCDENASKKLEVVAEEVLGIKVLKPYPKCPKLTSKAILDGWSKFKRVKKVRIERKFKGHRKLFLKILKNHCQEDVELTMQLYLWTKDHLETEGLTKWFLEVEMPVIVIFVKVETRGIPVDFNKLLTLEKTFAGKADEVRKKLIAYTRDPLFNPSSPKQVAKYLYAGTTCIHFTDTGEKSANHEAVEELADKGNYFAQQVLEYSKWEKGLRSYASRLLEAVIDGRIYTSFDTYGTETGRFASKNPNVQNIPKRAEEARLIRDCFVGNLTVGDYSQVEYRILGHWGRDQVIIDAYASGKDLHDLRATLEGITRDEAKTKNYRDIYANDEAFFELYPSTKKKVESVIGIWNMATFKDKTGATIRFRDVKNKFGSLYYDGFVRSISGRKRRFPNYKYNIDHPKEEVILSSGKKTKRRNLAASDERSAINFPMQGSTGDIMKLAAIELDKLPNCWIINQVHDEYIMENTPEMQGNKEHLKAQENAMLTPYRGRLKIPLAVSIRFGSNWSEGKDDEEEVK